MRGWRPTGRWSQMSETAAATNHQPFPRRRHRWTALVCVAILAIAFVLSGATKVASPVQFASAIARYGMVPRSVTPWLAVYLPWLEIIVALAILIPRWRIASAAVMAIMLVVFSVVLVLALARGQSGDCGCMGTIKTSIPVALIRNTILLAAISIVFWAERRAPTGPVESSTQAST